jgi:hypothetical protein
MIIPSVMGFQDFHPAEIMSGVFAFFVFIFTYSGQARRHEVLKHMSEKQGVFYGLE